MACVEGEDSAVEVGAVEVRGSEARVSEAVGHRESRGLPMSALVFVYGTLMHEQPNHRVLVEIGARHQGAAMTVAKRTLVDLGPYPALLPVDGVRDASGSHVAGEVYAIAEAELAVLDAFEGCPDLYVREAVALAHAGAVVDAWAYVLAEAPPPHAVIVAGGRYGR